MMLSRHWNDLELLTVESRYISFLCMLVVKSSLFQQSQSVTVFFCCDSCTSKPLEGIRLSGIIGNHIPKLEYDMTELYIVNVEHIKNFRVLVLVMPTPCQEEAYGN